MLRFINVDATPTRLPPVYGYHTHALLPLRQALDPLRSRINGLDRFIQIAKTECHFPSEHDLTREESASIYIYTMDWGEQSLYRVLNEELRVKDRSVLVPWHGYLKLFDTALSKLPSLQTNLWRGINVDISKYYKENVELTWWQFNSCSSSLKVVQKFLGSQSTLLMIEAKNGKSISAYSNFPDENEVILPLGTRVLVMSDALDHPSFNVIHFKELNDDTEQRDLASSLGAMKVDKSMKKTSGSTHSSKAENPSLCEVKTYADGSKYEGEMKDGKMHGKGTYYFVSGEKYVGDWLNHQKEGQGVFTWANGDRYEGQWKDGKRNGKGTNYYASGNKYIGDWVNDQLEGQGIHTCPSSDRYEGQWKDGKRNGKGTNYFADGRKYVGDWVNDQLEGQGIHTCPSGDRYEGQWRDAKKNGIGKMP